MIGPICRICEHRPGTILIGQRGGFRDAICDDPRCRDGAAVFGWVVCRVQPERSQGRV